jgi:hypothetical protein
MRLLRAGGGFSFLLLAALNSVLARTADTCTQNSPDSLYVGYITILFNLIGFAILGWKLPLRWLLPVLAVPMMFAAHYSYFALWFADGYLNHGLAACSVIAPDGNWEPSGDEPVIARIWIGALLSFWLPFAIASWKAVHYRPVHESRYAE